MSTPCGEEPDVSQEAVTSVKQKFELGVNLNYTMYYLAIWDLDRAILCLVVRYNAWLTEHV